MSTKIFATQQSFRAARTDDALARDVESHGYLAQYLTGTGADGTRDGTLEDGS